MSYIKPYCPCPTPSKPVISNAGNNNTHFTQKFMQSVIIINSRYTKGGRISYIKPIVNDLGEQLDLHMDMGNHQKIVFKRFNLARFQIFF